MSAIRGGASDMVMLDADGDHERNVTNHPAVDIHPAWIPDGRSFVFASYHGRSGADDTWRHDVTTGEARGVTDGVGECDLPQPSPDGSRIALPDDRT